MSDDGVGTYEYGPPEPSYDTSYLAPEFDHERGFGEDFEPRQMVETLEGLMARAVWRGEYELHGELERIVRFIEAHEDCGGAS